MSTRKTKTIIFQPLPIVLLSAVQVFSQSANSANVTASTESGNGWLFVFLVALVIAVGGGVAWWYKKKEENARQDDPGENQSGIRYDGGSAVSDEAGNGDVPEKNYPKGFPRASKVFGQKAVGSVDFDEVKEKIERIRFERLPINRFKKLRSPKPFDALPLSNDASLLSAVEQTQDEYEEDEEIRTVSVRILARFRSRNAVASLSEIALYDLSAALRSKAVAALAEFDHESVFEAILMACADPTREVRAAGAKALFRLSFSRADAWIRIAECGNKYRVVQAARAAIEADFVGRSLDRLVHKDEHHAYEALALLALLIEANETKELFGFLETHQDRNVMLAILRVFAIVRDERFLPGLQAFTERDGIPEEVVEAARELLASFEPVPA